MTSVVDLQIYEWQSGPQQGEESLWSFRLAGEASDLFSRLWRLPRTQAYYYRQERRWEVVPSVYLIDLLDSGTDNFNQTYRRARKKLEEGWT